MDTEIIDYSSKFEKIKGVNKITADGGDMVKEDRRRLVLEFMSEHPLALPPTVWYRNLSVHRTVTFGKDSLRNYLDEFVDEGLVERVNKEDLDGGDITPVSDDEYRAYYLITDSGREEVESF